MEMCPAHLTDRVRHHPETVDMSLGYLYMNIYSEKTDGSKVLLGKFTLVSYGLYAIDNVLLN